MNIRRNVIDIDPEYMTEMQKDMIKTLLRERNQFDSNGNAEIPAGEHSIRYLMANYVLRFKHTIEYSHLDFVNGVTDHDEFAQQLLTNMKGKKVIIPGLYGVSIKDGGSEKWHLFELKNTLLVRKKVDNVYYFDIADDDYSHRVGEGNFGTVKTISGTVKPRFFNPEDMFFSPGNDKRVLKKQEHSIKRNRSGSHHQYEKLGRAHRENAFLQNSSHSRARDLHVVYQADKAVSYIPSKHYDGNDLQDVIMHDKRLLKSKKYAAELEALASGTLVDLTAYHKKLEDYLSVTATQQEYAMKLKPVLRSELTVLDRIELSIRILREYHREVENKDILHRDIKPENIFMDKSRYSLLYRPRFIDFGLSCKASSMQHNSRAAGAPLYRAPETLNGKSNTTASDIYSMMRVIGEIWRDKEIREYEKQALTLRAFAMYRRAETDVKFELFDGIKLHNKLADMIRAALENGTSSPENRRSTCVDIHEDFEKIRLEYYLLEAQQDHHQKLRQAHASAIKALNSPSFAGGQSIQYVMSEIKNALNDIDDDPAAIDLFTRTLDVDVLRYCCTKDSVISRMDALWERYHTALKLFADSLDDFVRSANNSQNQYFKQYAAACTDWMVKIKKDIVSIDDLREVTARLYEKCNKMAEAEKYYQNLQMSAAVTGTHKAMKI